MKVSLQFYTSLEEMCIYQTFWLPALKGNLFMICRPFLPLFDQITISGQVIIIFSGVLAGLFYYEEKNSDPQNALLLSFFMTFTFSPLFDKKRPLSWPYFVGQ